MTPEKARQSRSDTADPVIPAILAAIGSVGNRRERGQLLEEVSGLIGEPLRWSREYIHWPTGMGAHCNPVEVSVSLNERGAPSLRLLADLQDHRFQLAGNWGNYLRTGARITGASEAQVALLMSQHLDVDPPNTRTPVYHGMRYGAKGRHASLYFSTVTWPSQLMRQRIPATAAIAELQREGSNAPWVHLVGYDFDEAGSIYRTKLYAWLDRDGALRKLADGLHDAPGIDTAQGLLDRLTKVRRMDTPQESTLAQFSMLNGSKTWTRKLYLHAPKWRFDNAAGLGEVVRFMASEWGADVSNLMDVLTLFSSHGVRLLPTGIAVGLTAKAPPPYTFYFVPTVGLPAISGVTRARLRSIYARSIKAIVRQADGGWPDLAERGRADTLSRIRLALSGQPAVRGKLAEWRLADTSATCRARELLTCVRLGVPADAGECEASAPPELTALRLLIGLESKRGSDDEIISAVERLIAQERWGGGWAGPGGELEVTVVVMEALLKTLHEKPSLSERLTPLLGRTIHWLRALPVPREPARVALWIKGIVIAGDTRCRVSVERGLAYLAECQQKDGTWLPSALESADGDRACVDAHGWLATALVSEALARFV